MNRYRQIIFAGYYRTNEAKQHFFQTKVFPALSESPPLILECDHSQWDNPFTHPSSKFLSVLAEIHGYGFKHVMRGLHALIKYWPKSKYALMADYQHHREVEDPKIKRSVFVRLKQYLGRSLRNAQLICRSIAGLGLQLRYLNQLNTSRDDLIICFNSNFPTHLMIKEYAYRNHIPIVFTEYGNISGTMLFGREGISSELDTVRHVDTFKSLPVTDEEITRAELLIKHPPKGRTDRMEEAAPQPSNKEGAESNRILYVESGLLGNGLIPRSNPASTATSPWFKDNATALTSVLQSAAENDWRVWYRRHPNMPPSLKPKVNHSHMDEVEGMTLEEQIQAASVVVVITSKVAQTALALRKPVVLLGVIPLSGHGCCYEYHAGRSMAELIKQALDKGVTEEQYSHFLEYVARELKYHLYWMNHCDPILPGRSLANIGEDLHRLSKGGVLFEESLVTDPES